MWQRGDAWQRWGCMVMGGMCGKGGACMGYDEIRKYDQ